LFAKLTEPRPEALYALLGGFGVHSELPLKDEVDSEKIPRKRRPKRPNRVLVAAPFAKGVLRLRLFGLSLSQKLRGLRVILLHG
jgi:hypothetical protein